jgi:bacterioferritin
MRAAHGGVATTDGKAVAISQNASDITELISCSIVFSLEGPAWNSSGRRGSGDSGSGPPKLALREAPQRSEVADRMRHLVRQDSPGYDYLMTSEEQIDVENFVALLNEDLGTEYQSIIQYTNHIATITGAEFLGVIDELKLHIGQELSHAQVLAEQVSFLGGEPATVVPSVERASDSRNALKADLRLETDQLERYRQRFAQANELNLADVAEALRPLLEQTQEHVRDLRTALGD